MHSRMAIVGVHPRTPRRAQHPTARRITAGMEMTLLPDEAWLQTIAVNSPLRRNVTIDDVGNSALYLLSDLSSGVTGENLHVDSGYHIVGMKAVDAPDVEKG